jgi:tail protein
MNFNSHVYNSGLFGGGSASVEMFSTDTLVFDGFSLSNGTDMILTGLRFLGPSREIIGGVIPRGDGLYQTGDYFRELVIEAAGVARADTAAELDALLDTIRKNLRGSRRNLDTIDSNGTVKRFVATVDSFEDLFASREHFHITFCPWIVRFKCRIPFGKSRDYTTETNSLTTSPTNQTISNPGTTKAQPVFILIFNSATSITAAAVENTTTGEQIQYTGTLSAGDLLEFDSENKTVKLNGTAVDYSGAFPSLDTDTNVIQYTVTGSAFDVLATSKFKNSYLS